MCLATMAYVYAQHVQYVLLFLVLVINSNQFCILLLIDKPPVLMLLNLTVWPQGTRRYSN